MKIVAIKSLSFIFFFHEKVHELCSSLLPSMEVLRAVSLIDGGPATAESRAFPLS